MMWQAPTIIAKVFNKLWSCMKNIRKQLKLYTTALVYDFFKVQVITSVLNWVIPFWIKVITFAQLWYFLSKYNVSILQINNFRPWIFLPQGLSAHIFDKNFSIYFFKGWTRAWKRRWFRIKNFHTKHQLCEQKSDFW